MLKKPFGPCTSNAKVVLAEYLRYSPKGNKYTVQLRRSATWAQNVKVVEHRARGPGLSWQSTLSGSVLIVFSRRVLTLSLLLGCCFLASTESSSLPAQGSSIKKLWYSAGSGQERFSYSHLQGGRLANQGVLASKLSCPRPLNFSYCQKLAVTSGVPWSKVCLRVGLEFLLTPRRPCLRCAPGMEAA